MAAHRKIRSVSRFTAILHLSGKAALLRLAALSLLSAASEGMGFVLLVPLLAHAGGATLSLPFGLTLPNIPLSMLLVAFVGLVVMRAVSEVARALAAQDLRVAVVDGLRRQAIAGLLGAGWRWLGAQRKGESEALLISNIDRAGYAIDLVARLVRIAFGLAALALAALAISPAAALTGAAAGALVLLSFTPLRARARRIGEVLLTRHEHLHSRLGETLDALRVIKSYRRETLTASELEEDLSRLRAAERDYVRDSALAQATLQIGGALVAAAFGWFALDGLEMPLAILLPLAAIFVRALPLLSELQSSWQGWSHEAPALDQALTAITAARSHQEPVRDAPAPALGYQITLTGITVAHDEKRASLKGLDLVIEARKLLVLSGPSGAGKSTLADIVSGLIPPDRGSVAIDDVILDDSNRRAWRSRVAYVQQEPVLFSGSVRDNLLWAMPDASMDQMLRALQEAAATFVFSLPQGIDCDLGEGGRALSGGERQRIALARALLCDPQVIILDEATSAIDAASEEAIAAALHRMSEQRTVVAIAHRGLLLDIADKVVRIEGGRVDSC